jgi:hypothetical protein
MKSINRFSICIIVLFVFALVSTHAKDKLPGKFFLTSDNGITWTAADSGFPNEEIITTWINHGSQLIAGTSNHGVYFFDTKSRHWSASNSGLPDRAQIRAMIQVGNAILASEANLGLFVSHDGGQHWQRTSSPENILISLTSVSPAKYQAQIVRSLIAVNGAIYAGTDDGIYKATSIGKSWKLVESGVQVNDFISFRGSIFAATNKGVMRSVDGNIWDMVMSEKAVSRLALTEKEIAATSFNGRVMISDGEGNSWMTLAPLLESQYTFHLTPTSSKILIEPWMKNLLFIKPGITLHTSGLPNNVPFGKLIPVQGGVLVVDSNDGC